MKYRIGILLFVGAIGLTACQGSDTVTTEFSEIADTLTTTTTTPAPTTTAAPTTTTTTLPPATEVELDLPRSGVYGHVVVTLTNAEYSNVPPGRYLDDDPELEEDRHLYIGLNATYEDSYPARNVGFTAEKFALILADGTEVASGKIGFASSIPVGPGEGAATALVFTGTDFDLTGATIRYDDLVEEPLTIPLDGPLPDDPYPIVSVIDATAEVEYEGGCSDVLGVVNVLESEWDIDGGIDHDGERIVLNGFARSQVAERFVRIRVQAIAVSGSCGGTLMIDDYFRLIIDGLPIGTENSFVKGLDNGEGIEMVYGYRVPVDTAELILRVGVAEGVTADFPIPIPTDMP